MRSSPRYARDDRSDTRQHRQAIAESVLSLALSRRRTSGARTATPPTGRKNYGEAIAFIAISSLGRRKGWGHPPRHRSCWILAAGDLSLGGSSGRQVDSWRSKAAALL